MQIEKAFLFGKQIKAEMPPLAPNVYFEAGRFNPDLAYENTGFNNQLITRDEFYNFNNGGGATVYNIVKDQIGNGKIFQFLGNNAGEFQIVGNNIVSTIANPNLDPGTQFGTDFGLLYLPVRFPANTYSKMCVRLVFHDKIDTLFNAHVYTAFIYQNSSMRTAVYEYDYGDTVDVPIEIETNGYGLWRDEAPYIGIAVGACKTTEIEKIWFE